MKAYHMITVHSGIRHVSQIRVRMEVIFLDQTLVTGC